MLYAIAASATLIFVLAVPRSARARRRLVCLLRAQEVWVELIDRESQPRQECPLATRRLFRRLWISEMLMAGVDVLLVARMAGTSVAMIERVYGHFRNQSYQEAQARLDRERATRGL